MEAKNMQREFQEILEDLLDSTAASRTTVRLDIPSKNFHLDEVAAEALAPGVRSLKDDTSINDLRKVPTYEFVEKERRILVQNDCLTADPAPPPALIDYYGVKAQMLGPVVRDDRVIGIISVHYTPGPREWSEKDVAALEDALKRVRRALEQGS
jgi:GAF domain-containing protein